MYEQLSIFDFADSHQAQPEPPKPQESEDRLSEYAFLYTCTEKGNNSDIHFMMSMEDAIKFCESDISKGQIHGNHWAYFFTSVKNFVSCPWGGKVDLRKMSDNGNWDKKIEGLGLKKYSIHEIPKILEPLGVTVLT